MIQEKNCLEQLPQAALKLRGGVIMDMNAQAHTLFPQLQLGDPAPDALRHLLERPEQAGCFDAEEGYIYTRLLSQEGELLLFERAQNSSLTNQQLDGFSRQVRESMGMMLNQLEQLAGASQQDDAYTARCASMNRSTHQIIREMGHLDFLKASEQEAKASFHPIAMDLAGLCMQVKRQAAPLLRKAQVDLEYVSPCTGLLIPGDPALMQRLLLCLISNAAKASKSFQGTVTLDLRPWRDRALLIVTNCGAPDAAGLTALLHASSDSIPTPEQGAGMGLDIVRRIAALHNGTVLVRPTGQGGLSFVIALPTGPLPASLPLRTPTMEENAGLSPFLVELADLLPAELYQPELD